MQYINFNSIISVKNYHYAARKIFTFSSILLTCQDLAPALCSSHVSTLL